MKAFKLILIFSILFITQNLFAQTNFNEGYKKGYAEGFCYDKGISCIAPIPPIAPIPGIYESFDSYKDGYLRGLEHGKAESVKTSANGRQPIDFGEYYQPVDIYFVNKALSAKENSLRSANSYRVVDTKANSRAFVARNINPKIKKEIKILNKRNKNWVKSSKKIKRDNRKKSMVSLKQLSDGWYKIYIEATTFYKKENRNILKERFIQIQNGKPVIYIGNNNLAYVLEEAYSVSGRYYLTMILPDRTKEGAFFSIYDNKPLKKAPQLNMPKAAIFYTNSNLNSGGDITVVINREPDFPELTITQRINGSPSCKSQNNRLFLPQGVYNYYAYNKFSYWEGQITLSEPCNTLKLNIN